MKLIKYKKFSLILCFILFIAIITGCSNLLDSFRPEGFGQNGEKGDRMFYFETFKTPEEVVKNSIAEQYEFLHHYFPFSFPVEHELSKLSPIEISEDGSVSISIKGSSWSHSVDWEGIVAGTSDSGYEIEELTINIQLTENKIIPSSDGKRQVPFLEGEGTYSYTASTYGSMKEESGSTNISDNYSITTNGNVIVQTYYSREKEGEIVTDQDRADLMSAEAIQWIFVNENLEFSGSTELGMKPFENNDKEIIVFKTP